MQRFATAALCGAVLLALAGCSSSTHSSPSSTPAAQRTMTLSACVAQAQAQSATPSLDVKNCEDAYALLAAKPSTDPDVQVPGTTTYVDPNTGDIFDHDALASCLHAAASYTDVAACESSALDSED